MAKTAEQDKNHPEHKTISARTLVNVHTTQTTLFPVRYNADTWTWRILVLPRPPGLHRLCRRSDTWVWHLERAGRPPGSEGSLTAPLHSLSCVFLTPLETFHSRRWFLLTFYWLFHPSGPPKPLFSFRNKPSAVCLSVGSSQNITHRLIFAVNTEKSCLCDDWKVFYFIFGLFGVKKIKHLLSFN